jgi:ATP-dependent DNA helicase RecG
LIIKDIESYPNSAISDIHKRIGEEINLHKVRRVLKKMVNENKVSIQGDKKWRRYFIE